MAFYLFSNDRIHCFTEAPDPAIFSWGFDPHTDPARAGDPPGQPGGTDCDPRREGESTGDSESTQHDAPRPLYQEIQPSMKRGNEYLIIRPHGVDKGSALTRLAEVLGVKTTETIAFGDWLNDLPLFS